MGQGVSGAGELDLIVPVLPGREALLGDLNGSSPVLA